VIDVALDTFPLLEREQLKLIKEIRDSSSFADAVIEQYTGSLINDYGFNVALSEKMGKVTTCLDQFDFLKEFNGSNKKHKYKGFHISKDIWKLLQKRGLVK
jgi:hypothetical protein